ncbi:hypothetical protein EGW08_008131 [Elysia chlorotica]|uniref:Uncharacterized protein n=1 Tax=Elysia chlorotica TaxID=188477 RepID=A0A433TR42_ELYCH|nr:hypothetical protein EGW08_008131 [Elysia chlorotica]
MVMCPSPERQFVEIYISDMTSVDAGEYVIKADGTPTQAIRKLTTSDAVNSPFVYIEEQIPVATNPPPDPGLVLFNLVVPFCICLLILGFVYMLIILAPSRLVQFVLGKYAKGVDTPTNASTETVSAEVDPFMTPIVAVMEDAEMQSMRRTSVGTLTLIQKDVPYL